MKNIIEELPEQPGLISRLLGGQADGVHALASLRAIAPLLTLFRAALHHHPGDAYCPVAPMM